MAMLLVILPCIEAQGGGCILGKSVFPLARDPWGAPFHLVSQECSLPSNGPG